MQSFEGRGFKGRKQEVLRLHAMGHEKAPAAILPEALSKNGIDHPGFIVIMVS